MSDREISTSQEPTAGGAEPSQETLESATQPREEQVPEMSGGGEGSESNQVETTEQEEEK